jgi:hypothetical protein
MSVRGLWFAYSLDREVRREQRPSAMWVQGC